MSWRSEISACLGLVAGLLSSEARAAWLEATPAGDANLTAQPGEVITLCWRLRHRGDLPREVIETHTLPADWRLTAGEPLRPLAAAGMTLRFAALVVPEHALAGTYTITGNWGVREDERQAGASADFKVTVLTRERLALSVRRGPSMALAGESYGVELLASNRGNAPLVVRPTASAPQIAAVEFSPREVTLAPGESASLAARVFTAMNLPRRTVVPLEFVAGGQPAASARVTVLTELVPPAETRHADRWPAWLETRLLRRPEGTMLAQVALSGTTRLEADRQFSYFFRSAGEKGGGPFDEPELYRVDYRGPQWTWQAGNQAYSLSALTTREQFGSGASATYAPGNEWTFGGLAMRSRESAAVERQLGAFATRELARDWSVTVSALAKVPGFAQAFAGRQTGTLTLSTHYQRARELGGSAEIGFSPVTAGAEGSPLAARLQVGGRTARGAGYELVAEHYGEAFFGALRGAGILTATSLLPLGRGFEVRAEHRQQSYLEPYAVPGQVRLSNRESGQAAGLAWRHNDTQLAVDARHASRDFGFTAATTRHDETSVQPSAQAKLGPLIAAASLELGHVRLREASAESRNAPLQRAQLSLVWAPGSRGTLSATVSDGNDPYSPIAARSRAFGFSGTVRWADRWSASAQVGENLYDSREARRRSYAYLQTEYQLPRRQTLGLKVAWNGREASGARGPAIAFSYSRPIGIPGPNLARRGAIAGVLREAPTGEPVPRAMVVLNGTAAMTDERGAFAFRNLPAGDYQLQVERSSLGEDRMMRDTLPLSIALGKGEKNTVTLAAEKTGQVMVQVIADVSDLPGAAPMHVGGLTVSLRNEISGTELHELTDHEGRGRFLAVPPGTWRPYLNPATLPPRYRLQLPTDATAVVSGGRHRVVLAMNYEAPTIRWLATTESVRGTLPTK